jgi:hypothetical protein
MWGAVRGALPVLLVLCSAYIGFGGAFVINKSHWPQASVRLFCVSLPFNAKSYFVGIAQEILVRQIPEHPKILGFLLNRSEFFGCEFDYMPLWQLGRKWLFGLKKITGNVGENGFVDRRLGWNFCNDPFQTQSRKLGGGSPRISKFNARLSFCGRIPVYDAHDTIGLMESQSRQSYNGQFNPDCSLGIKTRSFGREAGCLVSAYQKNNLRGGNDGQQGGKNAEHERIERDGVIPRPVPNYRQPLPKGFGYLMLIAVGIGTGCGLFYVLILLWWNYGGRNRPKGRGHQKSENYFRNPETHIMTRSSD